MRSTETDRPGTRSWDDLPPGDGPQEASRGGLFSRLKGGFIRRTPRFLVRALARPYIAGETRDEAIVLVDSLYSDKGLNSTIDVLGEALTDPEESRGMLAEYVGIMDAIARRPHANISIKLSALGQAFDEELCVRNLERLLALADSCGQFVRFDMEDHTTTDSTLRIYRRMVPRFPRIGVVLQSRLHRTRKDLEDLAPLKPNVRLCLGIYREPADIALTDKPSMKRRLLELLEMMWENGQYVGLATHDEQVIQEGLRLADRMGKSPDEFEVQMLLGVPRAAIQEEILKRGIKVRLYVPYGEHWYHYCLRRLENNPEMASMVLGNLLRGR